MEIASKSQAENGADNTTIMTPLRVKQAINANGGGGGGTSNYNNLSNKPQINSVTLTGNKTSSGLGLQDTLISGTNIKTINNQSLLGSGNISISGGGNTYYFDGQNTASNLTMLNTICSRFDSGQEINLVGRFADGEYNQTFEAPINITKYSSGTDNAWAAFTSDPIPWLDNSTTPAKVRYLAYALYLTGNWGAYTAVQTYRLDDFIPGTGGTSTDVQVNGTSITSGGVANILTQGTYSSNNKIATMADLPTIPTVPTKTSDLINDGDGTHPFLLNGSPSYIDTISTYGGSSAYARNLSYTWDNGTISESHIIANYEDIPTKVSDLQNDSGFLTTETDPIFSASAAAGITSGDITNWNSAEANVQSDWNQSDTTADDYIKNKPTIPVVPTNVSAFTNDAGYLTQETDPVFSDSAASGITEDDIEEWSGKQDALVSGTNIKTINNASILGPGNLIIGEGGVMATDVEINGNSITSDGIANIAAEGQYDETTNKLVTQSAVSTAISNALLDLDYISYANESFTNPILGTTSTVGVVTIQKPNNPMRVKISDNVTSIRLNNNDIVYIGMDDKGKTRIYSNNITAFQNIRIGSFAWNVLSDGSVTFGGDE